MKQASNGRIHRPNRSAGCTHCRSSSRRRIAREFNASNASAFLERIAPASPVEQVRDDRARELLGDIRRLDIQLKKSHKRISAGVAASSSADRKTEIDAEVSAAYTAWFIAAAMLGSKATS